MKTPRLLDQPMYLQALRHHPKEDETRPPFSVFEWRINELCWGYAYHYPTELTGDISELGEYILHAVNNHERTAQAIEKLIEVAGQAAEVLEHNADVDQDHFTLAASLREAVIAVEQSHHRED